MGPRGSAVKACGRSRRTAGAKQMPGAAACRGQTYRWAERARAFDASFGPLRLREADEAAAQRCRMWSVRGEEQAERDWRAAQALAKRVEMLLEPPALDAAAEADGEPTVVEALGVRDL